MERTLAKCTACNHAKWSNEPCIPCFEKHEVKLAEAQREAVKADRQLLKAEVIAFIKAMPNTLSKEQFDEVAQMAVQGYSPRYISKKTEVPLPVARVATNAVKEINSVV